MKKLFCLCLLPVLCFALVACASPARTSDGSAEVGSDSASDINSENASESELVIAKNYLTRSVLQYGTGTDQGFYDLMFWPDEINDEESIWMHSCNILYTDYATRTKAFLCSVPGCLHNDESCTSYVRFPAGLLLFTNASRDRLFCLASGNADATVSSEEELGRIYEMNMDGSDRREALRLKASESFSLEDQIVVSDNQIFFIVRTLSDINGEPKKELRVFSIDSGSCETLREFDYTNMIAAAFDRTIVINDYGQTEAVYSAFDVDSGELRELYRGMGSLFPYENYLFFVDDKIDSADLRRVDLLTGDEETVVKDVPLIPDSYVALYDYFDEYITWFSMGSPDVADEPRQKQYLVNPDTGEMSEFGLFFDNPSSGPGPIMLIADAGDRFLVAMDAEDDTLTLYDASGAPHVYDVPGNLVFAMISKDDYYNSVANYNTISDLVCN